MPVRLHLTHIPELDTLVALEYGRVDEGVPERWWRRVGTEVGYLWDPDRGRYAGFKVRAFSGLDVDALPERWRPPVFTVPMLGLPEASAGEVVLAARTLLGARPSISHEFFALAGEASGDEALALWLCCLEAGESMAHYGIGATLYRLGRFHEAYRHLRYYTEISPELAWSLVLVRARRRGALPRRRSGRRLPPSRRPRARRGPDHRSARAARRPPGALGAASPRARSPPPALNAGTRSVRPEAPRSDEEAWGGASSSGWSPHRSSPAWP